MARKTNNTICREAANDIAGLAEVSTTLGRDKSLVLGSFGNSSVKTDDGSCMYIKASGTALKDLTVSGGYRRLDVAALKAILGGARTTNISNDAKKTALNKAMYKSTSRFTNALLSACRDDVSVEINPSVESCFHAVLGKYVVHLHPSAVLAFVCAKNGRSRLEQLFKDLDYPFVWVPYAHLGYPLAKKIQSLGAAYKKHFRREAQVFFLQNHGLVVSASTASSVIGLAKRITGTCQAVLTGLDRRRQGAAKVQVRTAGQDEIISASLAIRSAIFQSLQDLACRHTTIKHCLDTGIASFIRRPDAKKLLSPAALAPDEWHCCCGAPMWVDTTEGGRFLKQLRRHISTGRPLPKAFLHSRYGLFVRASDDDAGLIIDFVRSFLAVRAAAASLGGAVSIGRSRLELIAAGEELDNRPLAGRVAIVTGAGSGLGRHVAIGLARTGAGVAIADIDAAAAARTVGVIKSELPHSAVLAVSCDVTDESSVAASYDSMLLHFGGLDILVNAAGIAPPYSLTELPVEKWRLALEINLTGYFLMAKHAARILIRQGMGGSIVNISSKSGLEASKNNTPYNATKAGEIHMARGWALELGQHNIRVNSVCPGNVFEDSRIWNPEYIKVCAKKYGIKPEEVIPYYVSKTALNREIRGQDIADSVVFLCSDQARIITGQTVVTDAGQVMVR